MDARRVIDALTTTPAAFARATNSPTSAAPLPPLVASIRAHFPPNVRTAPAPSSRLHSITSLPELQRAVLSARARRARVRPTTSPSSPANHAALAAGDHVVDLRPLSAITHHPARRLVVVQAGVTLAHLHTSLRARGLALPVCFTPNSISIGAAFSTGLLAEGGSREGLLADAVEEVSLVDAFGRLRVFSPTANPDHFAALLVSHSLFGLIFDLALKVTPTTRHVALASFLTPLPQLLTRRGDTLARLAATHASLDLHWFPRNAYTTDTSEAWRPTDDLVWVRTTDDASPPRRNPAQMPLLRIPTFPQWLRSNAHALAAAGYTEIRKEDAATFAVLSFRASARTLVHPRRITRAEDAFHLRVAPVAGALATVAIALPVRVPRRTRLLSVSSDDSESSDDESLSTIVAATMSTLVGGHDLNGWRAVHAAIATALDVVPTVGMRVRVVRASEAPLAATGGNALSAVVEAASYVMEDVGLEGLLEKWLKLPGSRRVWGVVGGRTTGRHLGRLDGAEVERFWRARDAAGVDDYGMFGSDAIGVVVGPRVVRVEWPMRRSGEIMDEAEEELEEDEDEDEGDEAGEEGNEGEEDDDEDEEEDVRMRELEDMNGDSRKTRKATLSSGEWLWLKLYVTVYVLLWLALFGGAAIERLGLPTPK